MELESLFSNPTLTWFLIGLVLFIVELIGPNLVLIFFGAGAWVTSLSTLLSGPSLNFQIVIFVLSSVMFLITLRGQLKSRFFKSQVREEKFLMDEFLGHQATVIESIRHDKEGQVEFKGTVWTAQSDQTIEKGEVVVIKDKSSIILKVELIEN